MYLELNHQGDCKCENETHKCIRDCRYKDKSLGCINDGKCDFNLSHDNHKLFKFLAYLDYTKVCFVFIIVDIKVITKSIYAVGFINV